MGYGDNRGMQRGNRRGGGRNNNNNRGGGRGRYSNNRGPYRQRQQRDLRDAAQSGNQRERISVESGDLVFVDQFMLANPQFIERASNPSETDNTDRNKLVTDYGGCVVKVTPGTYRIERDPFALSIIVHAENSELGQDLQKQATENVGSVFVDTRCLAMIDRELLDDVDLLKKYQHLWFSNQEKACRDLLRDNGGAVRYGFQRFGDELGIYVVPGQNTICLWPDVAEPALQAELAMQGA